MWTNMENDAFKLLGPLIGRLDHNVYNLNFTINGAYYQTYTIWFMCLDTT